MITAGLVALGFLLLSYISLMLLYEKGWRLQPYFHVPEAFIPSTKITIVIPARNEEATIGACIASILECRYPDHLYEVIVVDDHSTDTTYDVVTSFEKKNVTCLRLRDFLKAGEVLNAYKKKAIETAVAQSSADIIVTTDADCVVGKDWLSNIAAIYEQEKAVFIIGPVSYRVDNSVLSVFQSLDFLSMQGITAAAHRLKLGNMSNGANLAFSRAAFEKVKGYEGIDHLASGDDYLLLVKMQKEFPGKIVYLKAAESIVATAPQPDWQGFINQRIRWASKMGKYDDKMITFILALVYLFNFSFLLLAILGFFDFYFWILGGALLLIKTVVELFYLRNVAGFFNKSRELFYFPFLQPVHVAYIIVAGFLGLFGKYHWKGRKVK
ncbi:MAG TPA: glycosyltransferase [Flavipsychrobacter sp.]|nr:glycosyltransferase [Flavipsychrobacter sp.]